ncbi:MAG TPA: YbaN family protein [Sphingomonadaceae bacterium]|nr:YbaN family protein [Sphingomonadaceae bacterium]
MLYLAAGFVALALAGLGVVLPLLPTVPFVILAAWCFARSSPATERRLLAHPRFGPPLRLWREKRAISPTAKRAALLAFGVSAALAAVLAPLPWALVPVVAAAVGGLWIWRRPEA